MTQTAGISSRQVSGSKWDYVGGIVSVILVVALIPLDHFIGIRDEYAIVIILNLLLVGLIFLSRIYVRRSPKGADLTWVLTGVVILLGTVFTAVWLKPFEETVMSVSFAVQTMTLIWAPVGSGFIVGPIMKVGFER